MDRLDEVREACLRCRECPLCEGRTNVVFGVGDPEAELMFIGEGPGANEDLQGEPFVGRAGQLLDDMLEMIDLRRDQVYIANIVKCRPPNNRDPLGEEQSACMHWLDTQLEPRWRLCLTVQDDGQPLAARTLDRGFTLRLNPKPAAPWKPRPKAACASEAPASVNLDISDGPLPAAMEARMDALRTGLSRRGATLSRRALDDAWRYCALMLRSLGESADPIAVLDRAVAQRLLPALLASASPEALRALPMLLEGLPLSRELLRRPVPIML